MTCSRKQLSEFLDNLLEPERFQDYCPNGLQVEGKNEIHRLVTGVTASQALVDEAIKRRADAILVHHGYFWRGEQPCLTGMKARRIRSSIGKVAMVRFRSILLKLKSSKVTLLIKKNITKSTTIKVSSRDF